MKNWIVVNPLPPPPPGSLDLKQNVSLPARTRDFKSDFYWWKYLFVKRSYFECFTIICHQTDDETNIERIEKNGESYYVRVSNNIYHQLNVYNSSFITLWKTNVFCKCVLIGFIH